MAERNPPSWLQGGSHPAEHDRLVLASLVPTEGIVTGADLLVTEAGTPDMTVDVAAGAAFVDNDLATYGGMYHVQNDAVVNLAVTASDPTNPRKDLVVIQVLDAAYAGGTDAWALVVLEGTPAASPVEPSIPLDGSYQELALIDIPAGATAITDAEITDRRQRASVPANNAIPAGALMPYAGAVAPAGWLLCDGAAVSRTTYTTLFANIGTAYGAGDGTTTFNLPDLRQRFPMGKAASGTGSTLGGTGGSKDAVTVSHTHTQNSHTHTQNSHTHTQNGHVHALNHAHSLSGGAHKHAADGDYGFRFGVSLGGASDGLMNAYDGVGVSFTDTDLEDVTAVGGGSGGTNLAVGSQNGNSQTTTPTNQSTTPTNQSTTATNQSTGVSGTDANLPPWQTFNYLIKAF